YWDDHLTDDEIDLICGVYHVATGFDRNAIRAEQLSTLSWWPKPATFDVSALNVGWWTPACEAFYQRRLAQMR
ncbi:hypothetical protein B0H10DRAFT_1711546, partial [Mycena sp. CBHHK59/15]